MRRIILPIILSFLVGNTSPANAASLEGKSCKVVGSKITQDGRTFVCSRSGSVLKWKSDITRSISVKPKVGSCYYLSVAEIEPMSSSKSPVSCSLPHTSVTFRVSEWKYSENPYAAKLEVLMPLVRTMCSNPPYYPNSIQNNFIFFFAPQNSWNAGQRWIRCDMVAQNKLNESYTVTPWSGNITPLLQPEQSEDLEPLI